MKSIIIISKLPFPLSLIFNIGLEWKDVVVLTFSLKLMRENNARAPSGKRVGLIVVKK